MPSKFVEQDGRQKLQADIAGRRGIADCVIASQSRQLNFPRILSIILKRRGISSRVEGHAFAELRYPR